MDKGLTPKVNHLPIKRGHNCSFLFSYLGEILMVHRIGVADEGGMEESKHGILSLDSGGLWLPRS